MGLEQGRSVWQRSAGAACLLFCALPGCSSIYDENVVLRHENEKLRSELRALKEQQDPGKSGTSASGEKESASATPGEARKKNDGLPSASAKSEGTVYVVKNRDALSDIAIRFYGDPTMWQEIYDANRELIGDDPDRLKVGMKLRIPPGR